MSLGSLQLDRSSDVSNFMQICAERVFALEDLRPALSYPTRQGLISVFVCADSEHLAEFFKAILISDPKRFYRLSRVFDQVHPGVASHAPGWTLTRFSGHGYFSLRLSNDIFVYRVPTHLRQKLIELAFAQGCYLDCSAVGKDVGSPQHKMPLRLALELVS